MNLTVVGGGVIMVLPGRLMGVMLATLGTGMVAVSLLGHLQGLQDFTRTPGGNRFYLDASHYRYMQAYEGGEDREIRLDSLTPCKEKAGGASVVTFPDLPVEAIGQSRLEKPLVFDVQAGPGTCIEGQALPGRQRYASSVASGMADFQCWQLIGPNRPCS